MTGAPLDRACETVLFASLRLLHAFDVLLAEAGGASGADGIGDHGSDPRAAARSFAQILGYGLLTGDTTGARERLVAHYLKTRNLRADPAEPREAWGSVLDGPFVTRTSDGDE